MVSKPRGARFCSSLTSPAVSLVTQDVNVNVETHGGWLMGFLVWIRDGAGVWIGVGVGEVSDDGGFCCVRDR